MRRFEVGVRTDTEDTEKFQVKCPFGISGMLSCMTLTIGVQKVVYDLYGRNIYTCVE